MTAIAGRPVATVVQSPCRAITMTGAGEWSETVSWPVK
jgi:hypothetical protein